MSCTEQIRKFIYHQPDDALFTSRDLVSFGARPAVDQAVSRLIENHEITRVARGVFIKFGATWPTVNAVALAKAKSFGKTLLLHGKNLAIEFNIIPIDQTTAQHSIDDSNAPSNGKPEIAFQVSGRSSSFQFEGMCIRLHGTCQRRIHLGESKRGRLIRALWYAGKTLSKGDFRLALSTFTQDKLRPLLNSSAWMPGWLSQELRSLCELP